MAEWREWTFEDVMTFLTAPILLIEDVVMMDEPILKDSPEMPADPTP